MQIIIEVKNPGILNRLLDLLKRTDWLGITRIWRKADEQSSKELVYDSTPSTPPSDENQNLDYREFWSIIQPPLGIETTDQLIAEMRED